MSELLKVSNITKTFGGIVAVNDLSFEIHEGETLGFIGPNGAGKSTVVNVLSGYLDADSGQDRNEWGKHHQYEASSAGAYGACPHLPNSPAFP